MFKIAPPRKHPLNLALLGVLCSFNQPIFASDLAQVADIGNNRTVVIENLDQLFDGHTVLDVDVENGNSASHNSLSMAPSVSSDKELANLFGLAVNQGALKYSVLKNTITLEGHLSVSDTNGIYFDGAEADSEVLIRDNQINYKNIAISSQGRLYGINATHNGSNAKIDIRNTAINVNNIKADSAQVMGIVVSNRNYAVENTVLNIHDSTITNGLIVGVGALSVDSLDAKATHVSLTGKTVLDGSTVRASYCVGGSNEKIANNKLSIALEGSTSVKSIEGFDQYHLTAKTLLETPALSIGSLDLTGSSVLVDTAFSAEELKSLQGDKTTYIFASENALNTDKVADINKTITQKSFGTTYNFDVLTEEKRLGIKFTGSDVTEEAETLDQVPLASLGLLAQAANMLEYVQAAPVFGTVRVEKGEFEEAQNLELHGNHFIFGSGNDIVNPTNTILVAGFMEAGDGDYDATSTFNQTVVKADGENSYYGGGLLVRQTMTEGAFKGMYWEGAARVGRMKTDYASTFTDSLGHQANFETKNLYYGAQVNLGFEWQFSNRSTVTPYLKGLWTHVEGDTVDLYGEKLSYDDTDMFRLRTGFSYAYQADENVAFTAGLAYDHIFHSEQSTMIDQQVVDSEDIDGGSAVFELGLRLTPTNAKDLTVEVMARGYKGNYDGIAGIANVNYRF